MRTRRRVAPTALLLPALSMALAVPSAPAPRTLVICSPGSPGTTAQAQPTLDAFARAAEGAAGWPRGSLEAVYFESVEGGLSRLPLSDAALALVPLPFLSRYGNELKLRPRLSVIPESGTDEIWSLVAKKGKVTAPASLAGWELTGTPGYAADFVRNAVLGDWGNLPADTRITFTPRALTALRRAASGEKVGILLDRVQAAALPSLPFAADLEVVHRSEPLPGVFLCTVADRLSAADAQALLQGLLHLHQNDAGRDVLKSLRMARFAPLDAAARGRILRLLGGAPGSKP